MGCWLDLDGDTDTPGTRGPWHGGAMLRLEDVLVAQGRAAGPGAGLACRRLRARTSSRDEHMRRRLAAAFVAHAPRMEIAILACACVVTACACVLPEDLEALPAGEASAGEDVVTRAVASVTTPFFDWTSLSASASRCAARRATLIDAIRDRRREPHGRLATHGRRLGGVDRRALAGPEGGRS